MANDEGNEAPPWTQLRELENAAWQFQKDGPLDDPAVRHAVRVLLAPGSSIGGARPKAGVCDEEQNLWIAKFPERYDAFDVGAWEMVVYKLAVAAGINIAPARADTFGQKHTTYMTKRFDRVVADGIRKRLHFASAMTMLQWKDGQEGASYLDIIDFLIKYDQVRDAASRWRDEATSMDIPRSEQQMMESAFRFC